LFYRYLWPDFKEEHLYEAIISYQNEKDQNPANKLKNKYVSKIIFKVVAFFVPSATTTLMLSVGSRNKIYFSRCRSLLVKISRNQQTVVTLQD
jgi:hypothetical protein